MRAKKDFSNTQSEADRQLIESFQAGDKEAFDDLVLKYQDKVFNLCFWYVGNDMDANDTAQDVFINILRSLNKFRFESAFSTWLYRITVNTCKNRLNSLEFRWRKWLTIFNTNGNQKEEGGVRVPANNLDPQASLETKERMIMVQKAINSLEHDKRDMVILRDIEGLSYEEISKVTNIKIGTVKSKIARARTALKEKLGSRRVS